MILADHQAVGSDFQTYANSAKNGDVDMLNVDIEPSELESLIGK